MTSEGLANVAAIGSIALTSGWIDVRNYGAAVDGVTDDSVAWTAAIGALKTGGVLFLGQGTSLCKSNIITGLPIGTGMVIQGTLQLVNNDPNATGVMITAPASNFCVDLRGTGILDGNIANNAGSTQVAISATNCGAYTSGGTSGATGAAITRGLTVMDGSLRNWGGQSVKTAAGDSHHYQGLVIFNCGTSTPAFDLFQTLLVNILDVDISGTTTTAANVFRYASAGVSMSVIQDLRIHDCTINNGASATALTFANTSFATLNGLNMSNIAGTYTSCVILGLGTFTQVTNSFITQTTGTVEGILVGTGCKITTSRIFGCTDYGIGATGNNISDVIIQDNTLGNCGAEAIVQSGTGCTNWKVTRNRSNNCGGSSAVPVYSFNALSRSLVAFNESESDVPAAGGSFIGLSGACNDVKLAFNHIHRNSAPGATVGISIGASCSKTQLAGNTFSGTQIPATPISDASSSTIYINQPITSAGSGQVSPLGTVTSGSLSTASLGSGTGAQISTVRDVETITPVTFNPGAATTATCTVELSPDNSTYSTVGIETEPAGVALDGTIHLIKARVPAGWYLRLTVNAQATLGTTTYY